MKYEHHFDVTVTVTPSEAEVTIATPGGFGTLAYKRARYPEQALMLAVMELDLSVPKPIDGAIITNRHRMVPGVIPGGSSHFGHYVGKAVVGMALDLGWGDRDASLAHDDYDDCYHEPDWEYAEVWDDLVADAHAWLDRNTVGGVWSWSDGDFRLDAVEECPECGCLRYSDPDMRFGLESCSDGHLSA